MKKEFTDDNGARMRFNSVERTLPEMWDILGRVTPLEVRTYDQGESVSVLVTQVCKGVAYGYPLENGVRKRNSWYTEEDTTAVRIPDGGARIWVLVDMPFDDLEKALFRVDLAQGAAAEDEAVEASEVPLNEDIFVGFGKYRDMTVGQLRKKDPDYLNWALINITRFRERAERRA